MALTKVTGSVIKDSVSLSGNVSVGGTLTYQDVTNVDALGIGTFRTGVKVLAGGINAVGVITATSFVGSGAQLTGITGTTINTNADNRIITGSGTANTLNGEANLTWNGTAMAVGHNNPSDTLHVYHATDNYVARFESGDAGGGISLKDNTHTSTILSSNGAFSIDVDNGSDVSGETIAFKMSGSEKVRIDSSGRMGLGTNSPTSYDNEAKNLVVASADHTGITIASTGSSKRNNLYFADGTSGNAAYRGAITYDHNIDDLYVRTAGAERLRIDSSGRVGINQLSPDRLLEVSNDNAPAAKFGGTGGGQDFAIEIGQLSSNSSPGFNATGGSAMLFKNNGTESMRLISAGNGGGVGFQTSVSGDAKSVNVYTPGSGDGKYAMQIENGYASASGGNVLKMKCGRGDGTVDVDLIRLDLYNNTRIFSIDNSGLMRFRSGCGSGSQDALAVYGVRAWINFSSVNNAIRGKGGLSGITDRGVGQHTYNFSTSMPDDDYTVTCNSGNSGGGTSNRNRMSAYSLTTSNFRIDDYDSGAGSTPVHTDRQMVHVMVVR